MTVGSFQKVALYYSGVSIEFGKKELNIKSSSQVSSRAGLSVFFQWKLKGEYVSILEALASIQVFTQKNREYLKANTLLLNIALYTIPNTHDLIAKKTAISNAVKGLNLLPTLEEAIEVCNSSLVDLGKFLTKTSTADGSYLLVSKVKGKIRQESINSLEILTKEKGFNIILVLCGTSLDTQGDIFLKKFGMN